MRFQVTRALAMADFLKHLEDKHSGERGRSRGTNRCISIGATGNQENCAQGTIDVNQTNPNVDIQSLFLSKLVIPPSS